MKWELGLVLLMKTQVDFLLEVLYHILISERQWMDALVTRQEVKTMLAAHGGPAASYIQPDQCGLSQPSDLRALLFR